MPALRCSSCGVSWPYDTTLYVKCPQCLKRTSGMANEKPIGRDEAKSLKNHADFERWLDEHNRRGPVDTLEAIPVANEGATPS